MPFHVEGMAYMKGWRQEHVTKLKNQETSVWREYWKEERTDVKMKGVHSRYGSIWGDGHTQSHAVPLVVLLCGLWPVSVVGHPPMVARGYHQQLAHKNISQDCVSSEAPVLVFNPSRAMINSATENKELQFILYFTGQLILWKITSWVLGLDYSFDKSSRPLSFLFPLIICLWTILQGTPLCSTKDRRKSKPNWSNYFIARVVTQVQKVKPLTKWTTEGEDILINVLRYLEIYFISRQHRTPFGGCGKMLEQKEA